MCLLTVAKIAQFPSKCVGLEACTSKDFVTTRCTRIPWHHLKFGCAGKRGTLQVYLWSNPALGLSQLSVWVKPVAQSCTWCLVKISNTRQRHANLFVAAARLVVTKLVHLGSSRIGRPAWHYGLVNYVVNPVQRRCDCFFFHCKHCPLLSIFDPWPRFGYTAYCGLPRTV